MKKSCVIKLLAVVLMAAAVPAHAVFLFQARLTHDQEVITPPIPDEGSGGIATFILNDAMTQLSYDVRLFGLDLRGVDPTGNPILFPTPGDANTTDNVTRLHIHRAVAGVNGAIVFGMIDAAAGMRNDPDDLVIDVPNLHITGVWDLTEGVATVPANLATELDDLFNGGLYINVHTSDHAGGEIRGQILVPEPGSLALLGIGALGLLGPALRRRA